MLSVHLHCVLNVDQSPHDDATGSDPNVLCDVDGNDNEMKWACCYFPYLNAASEQYPGVLMNSHVYSLPPLPLCNLLYTSPPHLFVFFVFALLCTWSGPTVSKQGVIKLQRRGHTGALKSKVTPTGTQT